MAIILLAIGAILSAIGLYAIVSGYPMIEIERGWASVIAGSVLLSGGLVVVALGLVLRALTRMRSALPMGALAAPAPAPLVSEPSVGSIPPVRHETSLGNVAPALAVAAPAAAAALAAGYGARPETPPSVAPAEPDVTLVPTHDAPVSHEPPPAAEPPADPWDERAFSAFDYEAEPEAHAPPAETAHVDPAPAPPAPTSDHPAEEHAPEPPATALHEPVTDVNVPPDEDFSHPKFSSYEVEEHEPEPHVEPVHADVPAETAHPETPHAEHPAEPVAEAPATAPDSPAANLSVIGRYDSEGTSYVMYSDGSIEAQSEAGVYRFGSMAELKAFIEG